MRYNKPLRRLSGVASVELVIVTSAFVVPLIICIWEIGRYIQVKQIVANSARQGARLAAQGMTIVGSTQVNIGVGTGTGSTPSGASSPSTVTINSASVPTPNVTQTVYDYLYGAGLTQLSLNDVTVTFTMGSSLQPYQGTIGQVFTVYVSIPWSKVQWTTLGLIKPTTVQYTVSWQMLVDNPFTINPSLPTW